MKIQAYELNKQYLFEVEGVLYFIDDFTYSYAEVEEVRKNGQEDTHMRGSLLLNEDEKWEWEDENFSCYAGVKTAQAILDYVQHNGIPQE